MSPAILPARVPSCVGPGLKPASSARPPNSCGLSPFVVSLSKGGLTFISDFSHLSLLCAHSFRRAGVQVPPVFRATLITGPNPFVVSRPESVGEPALSLSKEAQQHPTSPALAPLGITPYPQPSFRDSL